MMPPGEFVEDYLPLVRRIATRLAHKLPPSLEYDDLVQEGAIGLMQAAARFDPAANDNFGLYAQRRILGAMLDSVRRRHWVAATCAPLEDAGQVAVDHDLNQAIDDRRKTLAVQVALGGLPTRQRKIVRMVYADGVSQTQIAIGLRRSKDQVKLLHRQALDRLRPQLLRLAA
jgi:RNA polymerase sigma factor (sigma-70 family)